MGFDYEINEITKEESWRMFRYIGEMVEGFDRLAGIEPAVSIYGSARTRPEEELYKQTVEIAHRLGEMGFTIVTGGGPGIMEAANKGAMQARTTSVGLNIELPKEQEANAYTTRSITFKHFFVRKVMLVKYATAFIIMPGGLGTLDELSEVLTLMQTHKIKPFPVALYNSNYWNGFIAWLRDVCMDRGMVSEEDFDVLRFCDSPDEAVDIVHKWYTKREITGRQALTIPGKNTKA
jgi:uncharacterized protein (TIGR00730 family)